MRKYGERKTTQIMLATVRHVTASRDLENFRLMDFCSIECTMIYFFHSSGNSFYKGCSVARWLDEVLTSPHHKII